MKSVSELWAKFCEHFTIKQVLLSAWHPQTERMHRKLEQIEGTYIQTNGPPISIGGPIACSRVSVPLHRAQLRGNVTAQDNDE